MLQTTLLDVALLIDIDLIETLQKLNCYLF